MGNCKNNRSVTVGSCGSPAIPGSRSEPQQAICETEPAENHLLPETIGNRWQTFLRRFAEAEASDPQATQTVSYATIDEGRQHVLQHGVAGLLPIFLIRGAGAWLEQG